MTLWWGEGDEESHEGSATLTSSLTNTEEVLSSWYATPSIKPIISRTLVLWKLSHIIYALYSRIHRILSGSILWFPSETSE